MRPLMERSVRHVTISPPRGVEVYVTLDVDQPRWCHGELVEWALYEEAGWTGWCRYNLSASERMNGRFAAAHIRPYDDTAEPEHG